MSHMVEAWKGRVYVKCHAAAYTATIQPTPRYCNEHAPDNISPYLANSLLFKKIFSYKRFPPLFLKYCQELKSIVSYIFMVHFFSGGTLFPSGYICIKIG